MFESDCKVTIQQIGAKFFFTGQEDALEAYEARPTRSRARVGSRAWPAMLAWGIAERVDDFCATAYVYCTRPQPVPRLDIEAALADITRTTYETANPMEAFSGAILPTTEAST